MTKFTSEFRFPVSKGTYTGTDTRSLRTLPERLSDMINVSDWGAVGNNVTNDAPKIQAAIDFCIAQGGGKLFFPPGQYLCSSGLVVGSDTDYDSFVQLIGGGGGAGTGSKLIGPSTGWLISKGTKTYDLTQRVEGLGILNGGAGGIKITSQEVDGQVVTGHGVQIKNCELSGLVMVDASQAKGCIISDCGGQGNDPDSGNAGTPPVHSSTGVGVYLGDNCTAINCRLTGSNWITYALSGTGASILSCSTETTYTAVRVGWAPNSDPLVLGGGRELAAYGCTVEGLQTERQTVTFDLFNCVGGFIVGNFISGGFGTSSPQPITSLVYSAGTITATTIAPHNLPVGTSRLLLDVVDETPPPIAWRPNQFTTCNNTGPSTFTYSAGDPGYLFSGTISGMNWNPTTHVVTVTTSPTGANPIPVGKTLRLSNISGTWSPAAGSPNFNTTVPFNVTVTGTTSNTTTFTYAGPDVAPSGDQVGDWALAGFGWSYPNLYGMRCRKVSETLIAANLNSTNSSLGSVDLVYGTVPFPYNPSIAGEAVHANNIFIGMPGASGWLRPAAENAAGWKFINCGVDGLSAGANPSASLGPVGSLTFARLPGQFSDPTDQWQSGPFEAQEFDISDGAKSGGGAAVWGDIVQGGGTGKYKVRYNGANWIRIG